jgi:hypothetical protein
MWWSRRERALPARRQPPRRGPARPGTAWRGVALAAGLLTVGCEPGYYYGAGGGVAGTLAPAQAGGYGSLSARREFEPGPRTIGSYFAAEGTLAGWASHDSRGLAPMLVGAGGAKSGPFRLYVEGGVHILGVLERYDHQVFSFFGLVGGGGVAVALGEQLQLHLGARVLWSTPSAQIDINPGTPELRKEFLYFFTGLTLYFRPRVTPNRPLEDPI